jgi:hypothetical protein
MEDEIAALVCVLSYVLQSERLWLIRIVASRSSTMDLECARLAVRITLTSNAIVNSSDVHTVAGAVFCSPVKILASY